MGHIYFADMPESELMKTRWSVQRCGPDSSGEDYYEVIGRDGKGFRTRLLGLLDFFMHEADEYK